MCDLCVYVCECVCKSVCECVCEMWRFSLIQILFTFQIENHGLEEFVLTVVEVLKTFLNDLNM